MGNFFGVLCLFVHNVEFSAFGLYDKQNERKKVSLFLKTI